MTKDFAEKLREIDEYAAGFLSGLTFELRTPLNSIRGYTSLLKDTSNSFSDAEKAQMIDEIEKNTWYMLELVQNVTDINRMGIDSIELDLQKVDLTEFMEEVISTKIETFKRYDPTIEIKRYLSDGLPVIWVDSLRLSQIVDKLLSSTLTMSETKEIVVEAKHNENSVIIDITTQGKGISNDTLKSLPKTPAIWRMSYGDWDLCISRYLIEKHGGWINIENKEDKTSIITFSLPINATRHRAP